ncbi:hypothetical protein [Streptomyces sp. NPDC088736]|uniref:hypothetical protein n=1 Tax=Streptomyces sp. NPDC088736 TaxID=3365881 RepID=UPI00380C89C9
MNAEQRAAECEAEGDMTGARYWRHVKDVVDAAPELGPEQLSRLRVLVQLADESNVTAA